MSYLIAKRFDLVGCVALDVSKYTDLAAFVSGLDILYLDKGMQFVVLGNPEIYGEYKPYHFVKTEKEFLNKVEELATEEVDSVK